MNSVYITKTASFLPNEPVENSHIEDYLGMVGGKPSRAQHLILRNNQIKERYYALDREQRVTHTSFEMAKLAIEMLLEDGDENSIDLLAAGTASQEMIMPSHGVQIHGELGWQPNIEVVSFAGSCCSGIHALKYGVMAIATGDKSNAVAVASERLSAWMRGSFFNMELENLQLLEDDPIIAFEKDFLRFMLSDGASALLLRDKPAESGISLKVEWVELTSYAGSMPTCMYAGADYDSEGKLSGWCGFEEKEWTGRSLFALKQDTKLLGDNIVKLGGRFLMEVADKRSLKQEDIDWFLPHLSSMYFRSKIFQELDALGFNIPLEKWFVNLPYVGNIAAASAFIMIDELFRSGRLKKGERILVMVPESARFSYAFVYLTVCDYEG